MAELKQIKEERRLPMKNRALKGWLFQSLLLVMALVAFASSAQAAPPTITSFTPQSGPPGTQVTIMGGGFFRLGQSNIVQVFFNGVPAGPPA